MRIKPKVTCFNCILNGLISDISATTMLQKVLIMIAGINVSLQQQENEQCSVARYLLITKLFIVAIMYIIMGVFSIVVFLGLLIDVVFFIVSFILVNAFFKSRDKNVHECMDQWGQCIGFTIFILFKMFTRLNDLFNVCQ